MNCNAEKYNDKRVEIQFQMKLIQYIFELVELLEWLNRSFK